MAAELLRNRKAKAESESLPVARQMERVWRRKVSLREGYTI